MSEFPQVAADLAEFLMPAAKAATTRAEIPFRWDPPVRGITDSALSAKSRDTRG